MVKHIVLWKLRKKAHGNSREENARLIKVKLQALKGKIRGLISLEVGFDFSKTRNSADIALSCTFADRDALDDYQAHPEHAAIVPFIAKAAKELRIADYEI